MPSGDHVEVVREPVRPGERQRYTKRFLLTEAADYRPWTAREAGILARLAEQGVAHVVRRAGFSPAAGDRPAELQTFDAGLTVDQWATLLPARVGGAHVEHVFQDGAHWWALAHHSLLALDAVHARGLVHLDFKADNVCVPWRPAAEQPGHAAGAERPGDAAAVERPGDVAAAASGEGPEAARSAAPAPARSTASASAPASDDTSGPKVLRFEDLALIDFAFCAVNGEATLRPLPLLHQTRHDYQSPRLVEALEAGRRGDLAPTRALDWRCDLFSLAAMLWLYLPEPDEPGGAGWSDERRGQATVLVRRLLDEHAAALPARRPHAELIGLTASALADEGLNAALARGWTFAPRRNDDAAAWAAPLTRVSEALRVEPEPDLVESEPNLVESEPNLVESEPNLVESEPNLVESEPNLVGSEPNLVGSEPNLVGSEPNLVGSEPNLVEPEPIFSGAEPILIEPEREPEPILIGPEPILIEPERNLVEPAPILIEPEATRVEPEIRVERDSIPFEPAAPPPMPPTPMAPRVVPAHRGRRYGAVATVGVVVLVAAWLVRQRSDVGAELPRPPVPATSVAAVPEAATAVEAAPSPLAAASVAPAPAPTVAVAPPSTAVVVAPPATASASRTALATQANDAQVATTPAAPMSPAVSVAAAAPSPPSPPPPSPSPSPSPSAQPALDARTAAILGLTIPTPAASMPRDTVPTAPRESAPAAAEPARPALRTADASPQALLTRQIPQMALWADQRLSPVLELAEAPNALPPREKVRAAVAAARLAPGRPPMAPPSDAGEARRLNEAARAAYWNRDNPREALRLEEQALAANPLDAEIAGNLAFYRMRQQPPQVEAARQLSLHSLALPDPRYPSGRTEDWINLAITSALLGREGDARRAWAIALVVTTDVERVRGAGIKAQALYGDRLRSSVQAMLWRSRLAA